MSSTTCAACGKDGGKRCSRCQRTYYCSATCQKADWKMHKKVCFADGAKCTRCLETIDVDRPCTVPHPTHMLDDMGSSFGGGSCSWSYRCGACEQSFTKQAKKYDEEPTAPIVRGAKYCYHGAHTVKPLKDSDNRRIRDDELVLLFNPNLQQQINEIPSVMPNVRRLVIQSAGCYDDSISPILEVPMPKLEKVKLIDVSFGKVKLNTELTPLVEEVYFQNIPDECDLTVKLPLLKSFTMHYYGPPDNDAWIHEMLSSAKKLESFDSYKLRVGPDLHFAGNDLRTIRLHRAELLDSLSVYAPNLQSLNLQGCYGLDGDLTILETHPSFPKVANSSNFGVNTMNACISGSIVRTLESNPRVIWDGDSIDDDW